MNTKGIKLVLASAFGMSLMGLSQISTAGWTSGACPQPHTGSAPCVERTSDGGTTWEHFNGSGGHADDWHGPFEFVGTSTLGCSFIQPTCTLSLTGNVKKFQDGNGDWNIGVQVVSGDVTGSSTCDGIELSGFPWYAGPTSMHQGFGTSTGIPYPGSYIGNMGDINLDALGGFINIDDAHVHNVEFNNNGTAPSPSYFDFDSQLYTGGDDDNDSDCNVDGTLYIDNYDDINIY